MESPKAQDGTRREWLAVAALTAIGFGLRSWPVGRLGLNHFDEGIYALAATWSLLPKGLAGIDPSLIPYAPPGFPILGGLAYLILGRSDGAMIAVSQVAGTLTIPVVAWLARRTFGPGAGFAAATFCAFSGPHIAFSRMALTDASFLLAWLLALGAGMRFLERPGFFRAIVMGLAVGLAQQFKYNGWLTGAIVIGSAALGILVRPEERRAASILRTFGWGVLGGVVAWLVVWPWYAFVENHGGYSALLRHQRSYLGGFRDWWPNFQIQADQAIALSSFRLIVPCLILVNLATRIVGAHVEDEATRKLHPIQRFVGSLPLDGGLLLLMVAPYWAGLMIVPWVLARPGASVRLVAVWWLILSVMTPFYHPYARLWLPYHAANWLLMSWLVLHGSSSFKSYLEAASKSVASETRLRRSLRWSIRAGLFFVGAFVVMTAFGHGARPQPGLLAPSDSLYQATARVAEVLPEEVQALRLLARPPVTYYLASRISLDPMAGSNSLLKGGDPRAWALVDSAILRSELGNPSVGSDRNLLDRFANNWEIVEEFPTTPSLPTLLDLDPGAARSSAGERNYPLWLLRPRTSKARR